MNSATFRSNFLKVANVFRSKVFFVTDLSEVYKTAAQRQKEKLMELIKEKAEIANKSELARKMRAAKGFYTLEMAPPTISELAKLNQDIALVQAFIKNKAYMQMTVKQMWLLFLVGTEVLLWFFIGETIGKLSFVGYKVHPKVDPIPICE